MMIKICNNILNYISFYFSFSYSKNGKEHGFAFKFQTHFLSFFLPFILLVLFSNASVQPLVIAAHPQEANQFALGLSDGGVHVFEPLESEGKWGVPPPVENGSASSVPTTPSVGASGSEQAPR